MYRNLIDLFKAKVQFMLTVYQSTELKTHHYFFLRFLIFLVCVFLCCYGDGREASSFWIKRALLDLFLNDPDFVASSHIYVEKGYAKPFKAISQCK